MEKIDYDNLSNEQKRNLYLHDLLTGRLLGPLTNNPRIDKRHIKYYPRETYTKNYPEMTMYDYVYEKNKDNMEDVAIVFDTGFSETEITYSQLFENIDLVALHLQERGIKNGDKVAVSLVNIPESIYTIYALNRIGAIACLIDPRSKEINLEKDLKDLKVKMYIGLQDGYSTIKKVSERINLEDLLIIPTLYSSSDEKIKELYLYSKIQEGNEVFEINRKWDDFLSRKVKNLVLEPAPYQKNKVSIISYTGGTTGVHKGVQLSDDSLNTLIFAHEPLMYDLHRGDKFMNILPQFMIYGFLTLHLGLCYQLKTYQVMDPSPDKFVDYLIKINPQMCFGGPVHWETLINNPKLQSNSLNGLNSPISGGEKLSSSQEEEISRALLNAGAKNGICNGYGASELGGSVSLNKDEGSRPGTVGKLHPYDAAKIVSLETNEECTFNEEGELWISTPSMMIGYYNNEEENNKALQYDENGELWFKTGDIALIDENGLIEITGRKKRLFVCGLNNVYPSEMEEYINQLPNVKKCAVVNVPDKELREVPKVHVVLENDDEDKRKICSLEIINTISNHISEEVVPKYIVFEKELLYTNNGKIDFTSIQKKDLEEMNNQGKVLVKKEKVDN